MHIWSCQNVWINPKKVHSVHLFSSLISTDIMNFCSDFFCGAAFYLISCLVVYYEKTLELCQDRYHILSQYRGQNKHCWIKFLKRLYFWQFWFDMKKSNLKFWVSNIPCKIPWISIKILTYIFWNVSIGCVLMWLQFSNHLGNFYQPNSRCNFAFFSPLLLPTL